MITARRSFLKGTFGVQQGFDPRRRLPTDCIAPVLNDISDITQLETTPVSFNLTLASGNHSPTYSIVGNDRGLSVDPVTGHVTGEMLSWAGDPTTYTVTFRATSACGTSDKVLTMHVTECRTPLVTPVMNRTGSVGTEFSVSSTNTRPGHGFAGFSVLVTPAQPSGTWTISNVGNTVTFNGTITEGGYHVALVAENDCGADSAEFDVAVAVATPPIITLRYGNVTWPDMPEPAPEFDENFFTAPDENYAEVAALVLTDITGNYTFPPGEGVRQVMWVANTLIVGVPDFKVGGFPWGLTPGVNTFVQALTINGVDGQVFFTSEQNDGGYTVAALP